jgi:hypothetical protein
MPGLHNEALRAAVALKNKNGTPAPSPAALHWLVLEHWPEE